LAIQFFSVDTDFKLPNKRILTRWIKQVIISHALKCGEISFIFTNNDKILEINRQYLQHDYFTDIITFNYNQDKIVSGDIYISVDTVMSNSSFYNVTFESELHRVIIHGILHLVGFNDKTKAEQAEMSKNEDMNLNILYSQYMVS
jgi:probable rRNA maturation factor